MRQAGSFEPQRHDEHRVAKPQPKWSATGPRSQRQHRRRGAWSFLHLRGSAAAAGGDRPRSKTVAAREDFAAARAASRRPNHCCQRLALGPGGTPQEISRGQARAAGAAPGWATTRAMPQRGIEEVFGGVFTAAFPSLLFASGLLLRCPVGARSHAAPLPGAASAAADLPPANLLRRPSGTGTAADSSLYQFPCPKFPCPIPPCSRAAPSRARRAHIIASFRASPTLHALRPGTGHAPLWLRLRRSASTVSLRSNSCP